MILLTDLAATGPDCIASVVQPATATSPQLTLAGQVDLPRLVDTAAQRLKLNIDYDASMLKGQVTLRLDGPVSDDELWTLVNRVLAARGFTTVRQPGRAAYSVVKLADAAAASPLGEIDAGKADELAQEPTAGFQSVVVRAKHRAAKDLVEQLTKGSARPGAPTTGSVSAVGDSGLIVIADLSSRVDQVLSLLALLDTPGARTIVEEVPTRNLSAPQMVTLLTQLTGKRDAVSGEKTPGDVLASPDGNALLLIAPESALTSWKALIEALDKREPTEVLTYTPRHFTPKDVARLIEQTIAKSGTATGSSGSGAGGGTGGDGRWKLVIDDLTGSLIITGTPSQHESVRALLDRLDNAPASSRRPMRIFIIKHRPVSEVVETLEQLLRAGVLDAAAEDDLGRGLASPTSLAASPTKLDGLSVTPMPPPPAASSTAASADTSSRLLDGLRSSSRGDQRITGNASNGPTLTIDKGTNALIAVAEPRVLDQIETLLTTLDVRQPQVMLDVLLVTLTDGQTLDLGVELEKIQISGDITTRLSSLFGLGSRGSGGDRTGPDNASGFTGVVLNPGDFSVVLRALETLNNGRALSMPQLLVGNNQQATLDSVVQQPFASVNASNTVSTTSFGGTQDAGTVVTIQPQIAEGDHLLLQYSVSLSSFLGSASSPTLPPARQQNRVQSVATIPDGSTVVVGGIDVENTSNTISQVPLLGNIPILGEAFKSRNKGNSRSRFFVFIRANILRNQNFDDLKYLSGREAVTAQVSDGFPEVKPQVIR